MNRFLIFAFISLWLGLTITEQGHAAPPSELASSRARFDSYMQKQAKDYEFQRISWEQRYQKALATLMSEAQRGGDLDALLRAKEELDRFKRAPAITPAMVSSASGSLRSLQRQFAAMMREITISHGRAVVSLCESYIEGLERLQSQLVQANEIEAAGEVRDVRERSDWGAVLNTARFELAAAEFEFIAGNPGAPTSRPEKTPSDSPKKGPVENAAERGPIRLNGVDVYTKGAPSRESGVAFRRVKLTRTAQSPLRAPVNISALLAHTDETDANSKYKSKGIEWRLRLAVKLMMGVTEASDFVIVVQYYVRPARAATGKVDSRLMLTRRVPLTLSPGQSLILECLPVYVWSARINGGHVYGRDFYGVTISVFEAGGTLRSQSTSMRSLDALAPSEIPDAGPEEGVLDARKAMIEGARGAVNAAQAAHKNAVNAARAKGQKYPKIEWAEMGLLEKKWYLKSLSK